MTGRPSLPRRALLRTGLAMPAVLAARRALAAEKLTYLFPAPDFLPAFAPFQIARHKGYYTEAGVEPTFQVGRGGADVAKQVAVGNADLGGGIGDTPLIVRPNGLPVRGVALLGRKSLTQLVVRRDSGITGPAGLKGQAIGVLSFQDTTYYNLLAVLAASGIARRDANIEALGPAGVVQLMISGKITAMSGVPEWTIAVQDAGVAVDIIPIDAIFPAMAQAILASDDTVAKRPQAVGGFVQATLRAVKEIAADPAGSARDYVAAVPSHASELPTIEKVLTAYATQVYAVGNAAGFGAFDPARMKAVDDFYLENKIVQKSVPIADTFTNQFIPA